MPCNRSGRCQTQYDHCQCDQVLNQHGMQGDQQTLQELRTEHDHEDQQGHEEGRQSGWGPFTHKARGGLSDTGASGRVLLIAAYVLMTQVDTWIACLAKLSGGRIRQD